MMTRDKAQPNRKEIAADLFRDHLDLGRIEQVLKTAKGSFQVSPTAQSATMGTEAPDEPGLDPSPDDAPTAPPALFGAAMTSDLTGARPSTTGASDKGRPRRKLCAVIALACAMTLVTSAYLATGPDLPATVAQAQSMARQTDGLAPSPQRPAAAARAEVNPTPVRFTSPASAAPKPDVLLEIAALQSPADTRNGMRPPSREVLVHRPSPPRLMPAALRPDQTPAVGAPPVQRPFQQTARSVPGPTPSGLRPKARAATMVPGAQDGTRIVIHYPTSDGRAQARKLAGQLGHGGSGRAELRAVDIRVSGPTIRYFFRQDRGAARKLLDTLPKARVQDFTTYARLPRQGTLEIWLQ